MKKLFIYFSLSGNGEVVAKLLQAKGYEIRRVFKKGQKAIAKFMIWKYVSKKSEETEEENSKMFMKVAAFFSSSQVEEIKA